MNLQKKKDPRFNKKLLLYPNFQKREKKILKRLSVVYVCVSLFVCQLPKMCNVLLPKSEGLSTYINTLFFSSYKCIYELRNIVNHV